MERVYQAMKPVMAQKRPLEHPLSDPYGEKRGKHETGEEMEEEIRDTSFQPSPLSELPISNTSQTSYTQEGSQDIPVRITEQRRTDTHTNVSADLRSRGSVISRESEGEKSSASTKDEVSPCNMQALACDTRYSDSACRQASLVTCRMSHMSQAGQ